MYFASSLVTSGASADVLADANESGETEGEAEARFGEGRYGQIRTEAVMRMSVLRQGGDRNAAGEKEVSVGP